MRGMKNLAAAIISGGAFASRKETYHHLSSVQVLLRLLLFLEINTLVFDNQIGIPVVFSGTSQFLSLETSWSLPNLLGTEWNTRLHQGFHHKVDQLFRKK